jgi:hypothetical protein
MEASNKYGWTTASILKADGTYTTDTNNIDTHLMKNTEWGVVAYLSKSNYGQGTNEVWINNNQNYITGCAGNSISAGTYNGCQNAYDTTNGMHASTTGNIYGIYDMNGGSWEYISAYVNNSTGNLSQGSTITSATIQYKDVYTVGGTDDQATNYSLTINFKGDALYEISNAGTGSTSWFADYSNMPCTGNPWFHRGGASHTGSNAGADGFFGQWGGPGSSVGFRPVLAVSAGL